ncbi:MAG: hypothetical protein IPK80_07820 [Nannocystis sp.]|nr:hypothetical protein [Nannocystis sp.]
MDQIGDNIDSAISGGSQLFARQSSTGNLLRYDGSPGQWTQIGGPAYARYVAGNGFVAGVSPDMNQIRRWDGSAWTQIGGPSNGLLASGSALYSIDRPSGDLYRYDGSPGQWTRIGGPGYMFAAGPGYVVGISSDMKQVWRWDGGSWAQIGGPARDLATCGQDIYTLKADSAEVYRRDGASLAWTRVGDAPFFLTGGGLSFIAVIMGNQQDVRRYSPGGGWTSLGSPGLSTDAAIVGSKLYSAGPTNSSNVRCLYEWSDGPTLTRWPHRTSLPDGTRIAIRLRHARTGEGVHVPWVKWLGLGDDGVTMDATDTELGPRNIFTIKCFHPAGQQFYNLPWYCMQASNGHYVGQPRDGSGKLKASFDLTHAGLFGRGWDPGEADVFMMHYEHWGNAQSYLNKVTSQGGYWRLPQSAYTGGMNNVRQWICGPAPSYSPYPSAYVDFFIVS